MEMPDVVLACRLLINTNILEEKQRLARATAGKLTYANMKKQLRTIHECGCNNSVSEDAKVKIEASYSDDKENTTEMFYSNNSKKGYNRGNNRGFNKRGSSYNTREKENGRNGRRKNSFDRYGNISSCNICESINLWSNDCPENRYEAEMSLFSDDIQEC